MQQVDLSKIPCIPHSKSIAIMNQYLLSATQHVNKMNDYSEKELMEIDFMINQLENKIEILERKIGVTGQPVEPSENAPPNDPPQP